MNQSNMKYQYFISNSQRNKKIKIKVKIHLDLQRIRKNHNPKRRDLQANHQVRKTKTPQKSKGNNHLKSKLTMNYPLKILPSLTTLQANKSHKGLNLRTRI